MKTYIIQRQQQHQRSCARTFSIECKQNQKCSDNFNMYIQQYDKRGRAQIATSTRANLSVCQAKFIEADIQYKISKSVYAFITQKLKTVLHYNN